MSLREERPHMVPNKESTQEPYHPKDIVADRHSLVLIGLLAVGSACFVFIILRLVTTLQTGLATPWWGNATGLVAILALYFWYRQNPDTRSSATAHGMAFVATVALLIPIVYGMLSTIWWLSLVGFAMVLRGRRHEAMVWGIAIPLLTVAAVFLAPHIQLQGTAGEPAAEVAFAKIVFVLLLLSMALGFRQVAEKRAQALHESETSLRKLKQEFENRALTSEDLAGQRLVRLEHLNRVLLAIRNVSRCIVKEDDPRCLIERVCDILVESRDYFGAWLGLTGPDETVAFWARAGYDGKFDQPTNPLAQGIWPPCRQTAEGAAGAVLIEDEEVCRSCPLWDPSEKRTTVVSTLKHGERNYGILAVSFPWDDTIDAEEMDLIIELADDISLALHNIELQEQRGLTEQALRESEKKYRLLADNVDDMIWMMDVQSQRVTYVSPSVERMRGFLPKEVLGQTLDEILTPESMQNAMAIFADELASDADREPYRSVTMELEEYRRDGSTILTETTASFVRNHEGKPTAVLGITRDITERRRVERALREKEQALATSKKMESLGLMAGGIAHDLNNILSGIVSYPELLLMDLPSDSPLRRPITTIMKSGERAAAVVEDLLAVTRGVASGREIRNLNDIVEEHLRSAEQESIQKEHSSVTFETDLDSELLNASCSESHIRKSLLNLVLNASEAIVDSGTVTVSTRNCYLDEPLQRHADVRAGEYVCLTVSDNGVGVAKEHVERIFEPFYTRKVMGRSGTGLGLAVVWNTVQDHNGYVDVKSSSNGTAFELFFPATRDATENDHSHSRPADYRGEGEAILVVDDEENQRMIACDLLTRLGYKAHAVSSGEEAIEYLTTNAVDLLLLDMIMPQGINGRETYERIVKIHPNQSAIITSGYAETDDVKAAQKLGAGQYLKKPYTLTRLGAVVQQELGKRNT